MDSKNAFAYIQKCIEKRTNFDYSKIFLNSIVDDFKKISGAFSVAYNKLSHCSENTITKADK